MKIPYFSEIQTVIQICMDANKISFLTQGLHFGGFFFVITPYELHCMGTHVEECGLMSKSLTILFKLELDTTVYYTADELHIIINALLQPLHDL